MNNGWIKLYRKSRDNPLMKDFTAWGIFTWIMLSVNRETGETSVGRFWASQELGVNPSTFYKALKRLEKKYKVVTLTSNNRYTTIKLLNWAKYQDTNKTVTQDGNNKVTTDSQQSNTLQEVENKRIKNITNVIVKQRNPDIDEIASYFIQAMRIPKEDCSQRQSRQYWYLLLKESANDLDKVKWLIDQAAADEFLRNNITSSKDLYYKRIKLISRKRGSGPKIAVFGGGNSE